MTAIYRQGDVVIRRVVPVSLEQRPAMSPGGIHASVVLAEGEATGHAHRLVGSVLEWPEVAGARVLELLQPGAVVHEEHERIDLPAGVYEVWTQREYSPEAIRRVAD